MPTSRAIPPIRWRKGIVGDEGLLTIGRLLMDIARTAEAMPRKRSGNMMIVGSTITEIHDLSWEEGSADVSMSDEFGMEVRLKSPIGIPTSIGSIPISSLSLVHHKENGRRACSGIQSVAPRLRRICRVVERAVAQDPNRLRLHEMNNAAVASMLSAALTAHVDDAEAGRLTLPGPHLPFAFEAVRRDGRKPTTHSEFDLIVERASRMARPMIALGATLSGENVEVRMGACREVVHQADPMEAIRILNGTQGQGSL